MAVKLLNPDLYRRLCRVFHGAHNVGVHKPGQPGNFGKGLRAGDTKSKYRLAKLGQDVGEEFNVSCPICNDSHKGKEGRLWFNHRWGTKDPYSGGTMLWPVHCYNEECQSSYENRKILAEMILGDAGACTLKDLPPPSPPKRQKAKWPGGMMSLKYLAEHTPDHPAVRFCLARRYDPRILSEQYGVQYCYESPNPACKAVNRLVVPFYVRIDGKAVMAGWTARKLDPEDPHSKWVHSSNPTGRIVYGLAEAARYPVVVVGEGPGDKWAVGPQGVAMLGKTCREEKIQRIVTAMQRHGDKAKIVLLLDPAQDIKAKARGAEHHTVVALREFRRITDIPVYDVRLPIWSDPGSLARSYIWWQIERVVGPSRYAA